MRRRGGWQRYRSTPMAKNSNTDSPAPLRRRKFVHAAVDLPGVPAGTRGRVITVVGIRWVRYRVDFDNGVEIGTLDRSVLMTPKEWDERDTDSDAA